MWRAWIPLSDALALEPNNPPLPRKNVHENTNDPTTIPSDSHLSTYLEERNDDPDHTQNTKESNYNDSKITISNFQSITQKWDVNHHQMQN
jgi:hypothetical protein